MSPEVPKNAFVRIFNGQNYKEYPIDFFYSRGEKNVFEIDLTKSFSSLKRRIVESIEESLENDINEINIF